MESSQIHSHVIILETISCTTLLTIFQLDFGNIISHVTEMTQPLASSHPLSDFVSTTVHISFQ